jgi:phenylpropionate dioxygenase-like ring-hydroxylating dioxygenase large terminal subunit
MHGSVRSGRSGNDPDLRRIGLNPNFWFPLASAKDLKKGKTLGVTFAGDPIVLVRTESGRVYALEDRCAHRQMPLSCGVVTGEHLKCCYHAWTYNAEGRCAVPYLPKGVPMPHGVRAYPSREAYGLIFVFPGDPALAETVPFPEVPTYSSPNYKTMIYSRQITCHYSFMFENLMDMHHQFLHRRFMGRVKPTMVATRKDAESLEVDYRFEMTDRSAPVAGRVALGLGGDDPESDDQYIMTIGVRYPYLYLKLRGDKPDDMPLDLWVAFIQVDREQRVSHTIGLLMLRKPKWMPALIHLAWPVIRYFTERIFAEDRFAVEHEQRAYDQQGGDWNQEILPVILDLREVLIRGGVPAEDLAPDFGRAGRRPPLSPAVAAG